MKKILLSIALAAVSAFAVSAPRTHDGFFLNATMGLGFSSFTEEVPDVKAKLTCEGVAYEGTFKIGGAVAQNFILHGTIGVDILFSDLEASSRYGDNAKLKHDGFNIVMIGGGFTYYFLPQDNFYASASIGATDYSITIDGNDFSFTDLDAGLGFNITLGKEWWMNNELGLGVAFSYTHNSANGKASGYKIEASSNTFALVATLTFN